MISHQRCILDGGSETGYTTKVITICNPSPLFSRTLNGNMIFSWQGATLTGRFGSFKSRLLSIAKLKSLKGFTSVILFLRKWKQPPVTIC